MCVACMSLVMLFFFLSLACSSVCSTTSTRTSTSWVSCFSLVRLCRIFTTGATKQIIYEWTNVSRKLYNKGVCVWCDVLPPSDMLLPFSSISCLTFSSSSQICMQHYKSVIKYYENMRRLFVFVCVCYVAWVLWTLNVFNRLYHRFPTLVLACPLSCTL